MPQEFHVLRCYNCRTFQVEMKKKHPKWECKICHEKQSLKQVFMAGTSKDCRMFVQDRNRNMMELEKSFAAHQQISSTEILDVSDSTEDSSEEHTKTEFQLEKTGSKWLEFLPVGISREIINSPDFETIGNATESTNVTFSRPANKKNKTSGVTSRNNCIKMDSASNTLGEASVSRIIDTDYDTESNDSCSLESSSRNLNTCFESDTEEYAPKMNVEANLKCLGKENRDNIHEASSIMESQTARTLKQMNTSPSLVSRECNKHKKLNNMFEETSDDSYLDSLCDF